MCGMDQRTPWAVKIDGFELRESSKSCWMGQRLRGCLGPSIFRLHPPSVWVVTRPLLPPKNHAAWTLAGTATGTYVLEPAAATVPLISLAIHGRYEGPAPHVPYVVGVDARKYKTYTTSSKRSNKVDVLVLRNTKDFLEARTSIYHTSVTLQNTFMHAGTTSDVFLCENLEWLGLASNWANLSTTTALGVIHKGYFEEGMNILGPYLPQAGGESMAPCRRHLRAQQLRLWSTEDLACPLFDNVRIVVVMYQ
ncbi:hypothetical protein C8R48DRAFT_678308 [Suillus tomentosus]|nr:hypothetical protein C8R48DRAFT_678308 [Suillus tomentosus]